MLRNVFLKTLRDARRAIAWWSLGLIAMDGADDRRLPLGARQPET